MKLYDVTAGIYAGMPVYDGDPQVRITRVSSIADGYPANVSEYCFGSHTGTHVDPPLHFVEGGMGVDELPLDALIGPAVLVRCPAGAVGRGLLEPALADGAVRLLLKTLDGKGGAYIDEDAAGYISSRGVRLVGTDGISIERPDTVTNEVHKTLLTSGIVVIEGLDLSGVPPGEYELICLPLKVVGGDGAPARVVLRRA